MKKDDDPTRTAVREAKRRRRLPDDAACVTCGEQAPEALELHHVAGRANERSLTAPLCKNCHAKATEAQVREGVCLEEPGSFFERIAAILGGLASFFRCLAESLDELVRLIKDAVERLDAGLPAWRGLLSEGGA